MSNKELVYIGRIIDIKQIEKADRLELAEVVCGKGGKWLGIINKGKYSVGDTCQVYLQDSLVPKTKEFEFMKNYKYRVRIQRLRGAESECLIMPQTIEGEVGDDVTKQAGVTKYQKPVNRKVGGKISGLFPAFLRKTDEPNFQKVPEMVAALIGQPYYVAIKFDGSSGTAYIKDDHFGVCSRNYELARPEEDKGGQWAHIRNALWYVSRKYDLENRLRTLQKDYGDIALQFELIGTGIQGNPLKIQNDYEIRSFNLYDISSREYFNADDMFSIFHDMGIPCVDCLVWNEIFDLSESELRELAIGEYLPDSPMEGIVVRPVREQKVEGERLSFKVINPLYKD